ncbi:conserved hypothetical protein, partial [Streptomyces sp. SPB78]
MTTHTPPRLHHLAPVFLPAELPRAGAFAWWDPAGEPIPGAGDTLTVVRPRADGRPRRVEVPALRLPLAEALPVLLAAPEPGAHP